MRLDAATPVVVLRFHHGSLAIARTLGRLGVQVYGVDSNLHSPAMASRYIAGRFHWDFGRSTPADSLRFLLDLPRHLGGRRALLIAASDNTAQLIADHADELEPHYIFPRVDPALVHALSNKRELYHLAQRCGVPTPETAFPLSRADAETFTSGATFPVMVKGADGLKLERRTGRKMMIVHSPEELLAAYDELEDPDDPNLMLQEYIPGGDDTIWMFDGYFDESSDLVFGCTGRKLRQYPIHTGATSLGVLEHNETVLRTTAEFMKAIGYRGILDIGYRYDARDGSYRLLDPNPRIGSTFRLFTGENDLDVARILYLHTTGQPVPSTTVREGRRWIIEDQDLISCRGYRQEGGLSLGEWIRSYRGIDETAWFARDDIMPFLRVFGDLLTRRFRRRPSHRPQPAAAAVSAESHGSTQAEELAR